MTQYQIRAGSVFTLDAVNNVSIQYVTKSVYQAPGMPDMYYFEYHVRAKIQPALASSQVMLAKVTIAGEGGPKDMTKEYPGNPSDYFWKTSSPIQKSSFTATAGPFYATVEATIMSIESSDQYTYSLVYP